MRGEIGISGHLSSFTSYQHSRETFDFTFSSETALSCACVDLLEPRSMIMTLVNGGAHLDFRTRTGGLTPLHKSAIHYRKESIVVSSAIFIFTNP